MAGRGQGGKLGKEGARRGPECSRRKKGFKKNQGSWTNETIRSTGSTVSTGLLKLASGYNDRG